MEVFVLVGRRGGIVERVEAILCQPVDRREGIPPGGQA